MPIYDFECTLCNKISEAIVPVDVNEIICPKCKTGDALKIFKGTKFIPFKPYVEYNLGEEPVEIKSKSHLEQELRKRGLVMDNRPIGVSSSKTPRAKLREKAKKAREYINATS